MVVARGMAKDPAARYGTAAELARSCAEALGVTPAADMAARTRGAAPQREAGEYGLERDPYAPTVISD